MFGELSKMEKSFSDRPSLEHMGELIDLVESGSLTRSSSKLVLRHLLSNSDISSKSVEEIAKDLDLLSYSSTTPSETSASQDLTELCQQAIDALPSEIAAIRAGRTNVLNKVVGWAMKQTRGKADANALRDTLKSILKI
jgi:aspartyl-tRNA(Asn)/glutamyl-tRNA(Gln) amidotransferase subunit B